MAQVPIDDEDAGNMATLAQVLGQERRHRARIFGDEHEAEGLAPRQESGIGRATRRLLTSTRAKEGLSDFAAQWLRYAKLAAAIPANRKDRARFPDYTDATADAVSAGLRAFVDDALLGEGGGIRKLLTSPKAWVNEASAWMGLKKIWT